MKLILAGAGGCAIEIEQYLLDCKAAGRGILDSNSRPADPSEVEFWGVYAREDGPLDDFQHPPRRIRRPAIEDPPGAHYLIAIGDPRIRARIWVELLALGIRFATLIHPTAQVASSARIGAGTILCPMSHAGPRSTLGQNLLLNAYAGVGHQSRIGDHCVLSPYSLAAGHAVLGEGCFLGSHVLVAAAKTVGAFGKVAAGSMVYRDLPPRCLALGNPAKPVRPLGPR
ncbi:MAG TPA: hypothetical protein VF007_03925 [Stellaceae bacterium]